MSWKLLMIFNLPADLRTVFFVFSLCVTNLIKFGLKKFIVYVNFYNLIQFQFNFIKYEVIFATYRRRQHRSTKPNSIPLHVMWDNLNIDWFWLQKKQKKNMSIQHFNKVAVCFKRYFSQLHGNFTIFLTLILPSLKFSLIFSRASTERLMSRCRRRPKSLNIVDPPLNTMLLYSGRRTSIGQFWITLSTISEIGVVKSGLENSGWKKISGPRKRS